MTDLDLDSSRSRVRIHTFAEGFLARLAHDLELTCAGLSGSARSERATGTNGAIAGSASIEAPLRGVTVAGALGKDGRVDERALSPAERRDCLAKMLAEVFHARSTDVVRIEARLAAGSAHVRVITPNGKSIETVTLPSVRAEGDAIRATGAFDLSLKSIGSDVIKGPMGAFRVKDRVALAFDVVFSPRVLAQPA